MIRKVVLSIAPTATADAVSHLAAEAREPSWPVQLRALGDDVLRREARLAREGADLVALLEALSDAPGVSIVDLDTVHRYAQQTGLPSCRVDLDLPALLSGDGAVAAAKALWSMFHLLQRSWGLELGARLGGRAARSIEELVARVAEAAAGLGLSLEPSLDAGQRASPRKARQGEAAARVKKAVEPPVSKGAAASREPREQAPRRGRGPEGERGRGPEGERGRGPEGETGRRPQGETGRRPQGETGRRPQGEKGHDGAAAGDRRKAEGEGADTKKKPSSSKTRSGGSFGGLDDEPTPPPPGARTVAEPDAPASEQFFLAYASLTLPCSSQEARSAFLRVVKLAHPDRNQGDPHATDRFRLLNEGYRSLSRKHGW